MSKSAAPLKQAPAPSLSSHYAEFFGAEKVVKQYVKKFDSRLDKLRHLNEAKILAPIIQGKFLDCSVGTGRLIPFLTRVTEFHASDTSESFLKYVKKRYPFVHTKSGDLRYPLDYPSDTFDTVFSLRTLFAIGPIGDTIAEMTRICKPGGKIIFDYPNVSRDKALNDDAGTSEKWGKWKDIVKGQESPDKILEAMPNLTYTKIPLDMFFHALRRGTNFGPSVMKTLPKKQYRASLRKRLILNMFNSRYNIIPNRFWLMYENLSIKYPLLSFKPEEVRRCRRYVYVCTKH